MSSSSSSVYNRLSSGSLGQHEDQTLKRGDFKDTCVQNVLWTSTEQCKSLWKVSSAGTYLNNSLKPLLPEAQFICYASLTVASGNAINEKYTLYKKSKKGSLK